MTVGIIGGGASGMAAALEAARYGDVILFERQSRVGRKLSATGNGRCNMSNIHAMERGYHGENSDFHNYAIQAFPVEDTLKWFSSMGLATVTEDSGKIYPYSDQANSVVDVLRLSLLREGIELITGAEVTRVKKTADGFELTANDTVYFCQRLIVACGGLAGTELGGSMSGYKLLKKLGHKVTALRPNIVQIKSDWPAMASLKGVRAQCKASILKDGKLFAESVGEIQFADYGISGPVIMEISRDVCATPGNWSCRLDFLPDCEMPDLSSRRLLPIIADDLLTGVVHNRLGRVILKACGIKGNLPIGEISDNELNTVISALHNFELSLTEPMGFDKAQVTAGGVATDEFCPETMESKLVPGLYACGEVLDVDGDCGGYNLQWAWSSGRLAGQSAGKNNA